MNEPASYEKEGLSPPTVLDTGSSEGKLSGPVILPAVSPETAPGNITDPEYGKPTHMAKVRFRIALCSLALLAFIVVAAFATLWSGQNIENLTRLLEIIFAPVVAVVAAAVAFYYRDNAL